jgi:hypothetical protein
MPELYDYILERFSQPHMAVSMSTLGIAGVYTRFRSAVNKASNEPCTTEIIYNTLLRYGSLRMEYHLDLLHDYFKPLILAWLRYLKPDLYDGTNPLAITEDVRDALHAAIQLSESQGMVPILSNFSLQIKRPNGNLTEARRQVTIDCAYAARGIHAMYSLEMPRTRGSGSGGRSSQGTRGGSS